MISHQNIAHFHTFSWDAHAWLNCHTVRCSSMRCSCLTHAILNKPWKKQLSWRRAKTSSSQPCRATSQQLSPACQPCEWASFKMNPLAPSWATSTDTVWNKVKPLSVNSAQVEDSFRSKINDHWCFNARSLLLPRNRKPEQTHYTNLLIEVPIELCSHGTMGWKEKKRKVKVTQTCPTLCDPLEPARLLCPWNSPGISTGMGSCSLLQGIFLTQGLNSSLLHCRQILYHLRGGPPLISFTPALPNHPK